MNEFVEQDIIELLLADAEIAALLWPNQQEAPRLYWAMAPENPASPYAVLACVGGEADSTGSGESGMVDANFTIACRHFGNMEAAGRLARHVRRRIGELCRATAEDNAFAHKGRPIQGIFAESIPLDEVSDPFDGAQVGIMGRVVRFRVVYEDTQ